MVVVWLETVMLVTISAGADLVEEVLEWCLSNHLDLRMQFQTAPC
jgi:hypothetical protein